MKTLTILAMVSVLVVQASGMDNDSSAANGKILAIRAVPTSSTSARGNGVVRVADAQSVDRAAWFATNQLTNALFEYTGLYLAIGGGYARMKTGDFSQTTSYGEILPTTDTSDAVGFGRFEVGYQFDENWALALGSTFYGTAETQIAFPKYPNIVSVVPLPSYSRHVMQYRVTRYSIVPTYSFPTDYRTQLRVGLGVTLNRTTSHVEATYQEWQVGMASRTVSATFPGESQSTWSGIVSVAGDMELFKHGVISLSAAYAPCSVKVPVGGGGSGNSRPSRNNVRMDAIEVAATISFRR